MDRFTKILVIITASLGISGISLLYYEQSSKYIYYAEIEETESKVLHFYPIDSPNAVAWKENYLLDWHLFDAIPDYNNPKFAAYITWSIKAHPYCDFLPSHPTDTKFVQTNSTAFMYQDQSWVKGNFTSNYELKKHEQKHFDLAEVFARKLQNRISKEIVNQNHPCEMGSNFMVPTEIEKKITLFESEEMKLLTQIQDLYDNETKHGENLTKQEDWNNKIENWLKNERYLQPFLDNLEIRG